VDSIEKQVIDIVSRVTRIPSAEIGPTTNLKTELNVDSLQGLQIVAEVESKWGVRVPDEEVDFYISIDSIVAMVKNLTSIPQP